MELSEFDALIDLIKFKTKLTEKEITQKIGRNEAFISQLRHAARHNKGRIPEKALEPFMNHFAKEIGNAKGTLELTAGDQAKIMLEIHARQEVQGVYLAEIYAKSAGLSVAKVLSDMHKIEAERAEERLKEYGR